MGGWGGLPAPPQPPAAGTLPTRSALSACLVLSPCPQSSSGAVGTFASASRVDSPKWWPATEQAVSELLKAWGANLPLSPLQWGTQCPFRPSPPAWPRGLLLAHSLPTLGPPPSAPVLPDFRVLLLTPRVHPFIPATHQPPGADSAGRQGAPPSWAGQHAAGLPTARLWGPPLHLISSPGCENCTWEPSRRGGYTTLECSKCH